MIAERWQQVKAIFDGAVECDSADRAEFLRQSCGSDEEMRIEVESLLDSDGKAGSFIENPMAAEAAIAAAAVPVETGSESNPHPVQKVHSGLPGCAIGEATLVLKDRYEVERELGRGGMSLVYLARDRQLLAKRVVIKVLLDETSLDAWVRQKFLQEMEALARIDHPGVVGVLDTGLTAEGKQFLVMQYIEGVTLRNAIEPGGMNFVRAAGLIRQIGQALAAAHEKGVWHRDLKPENIMLQRMGREEHVKLIDFGIAGIQNSQFGGETTKVAGSVDYMAPEQFAGHPSAASDTYALGVIAYEMLTGQKPFPPDSMMHLAARDTRAARPGDLRCDLAEAADRSILKAMSFREQFRHVETREFSEELYQALIGTSPQARSKVATTAAAALTLLAVAGGFWLWGGRTSFRSARNEASIAVLPFTDLSPEKNQEFFSDGLAEELLNELAKTPGLRVAGRTSSFQFKGKNENGRFIGQKLNVETLLEGSVRRQGNRGKISVHLIKASDGFELWSESYDRELSDIFAVEADIATAVTGALKVTVFREATKAPSAKSANPVAFDAYLQGRYFLARGDEKSLGQAAGYFQSAVKLDPALARAWLGLGECRTNQTGAGYIPPKDGLREAREAVGRALALDPNLGEAYAALAELKMIFDWDWAGADESYKRALALDPGNASVLRGAAGLKRFLGHLDEAIELQSRAIEIDFANPHAYKNLGLMLHYAGRQEEARRALLKSQDLNPETEFTHYYLSQILLAQSHLQEALAETEKEKLEDYRFLGEALAYHALGRNNESNANLAQLVAKTDLYQAAEVYAFRGETEKAFESLQQAFRSHDPGLTEIKTDPLLKTLRSDPRYKALLNKMGLPL